VVSLLLCLLQSRAGHHLTSTYFAEYPVTGGTCAVHRSHERHSTAHFTLLASCGLARCTLEDCSAAMRVP
jgi:hypothetical protein